MEVSQPRNGRTFHPKTMNFTFFSSAHGTFSRIDHILGHKASLGKFKKIEIIPSIFSDHNAVRLDLNYRRKTIKKSNIWRLNNTLLNNQQITEEIKKEIKICIEMNENENTTLCFLQRINGRRRTISIAGSIADGMWVPMILWGIFPMRFTSRGDDSAEKIVKVSGSFPTGENAIMKKTVMLQEENGDER